MYNPYEEDEYQEIEFETAYKNVSRSVNHYLDELANGGDITNAICNIRQALDDTEELLFGNGVLPFIKWFSKQEDMA